MDAQTFAVMPQFAVEGNPELVTLLDLAREREQSVDPTVMPLVQWLHDTWRGIHERGETLATNATDMDRLRFELATTFFANLSERPVFDHGRNPVALRKLYYAIESRMLAESCGSDQAGFGSLLSSLRHAAIALEAGPDGVMPRDVAFTACGVGYRPIALIARFGAYPRGGFDLCFRDVPDDPFGRMSMATLTDHRTLKQMFEVLATIHRFGRYGECGMPYGLWFSADGHGRELLCAMLDGLVNRVMPDAPSGMGGTAPRFALTQKGVCFVLSHTELGTMFEHYNQIEQVTAYLADGTGKDARRVPFDIRTGAILGHLGRPDPKPAYVLRECLVGLNEGMFYQQGALEYLGVADFDKARAAQIQREDCADPYAAGDYLRLSDEEFNERFGMTTKPPPDSTTLFEWHELHDVDPKRIWTVVEGDSEDDTLLLMPGLHRINSIGFVVSEKPWPHENIEATYASLEELSVATAKGTTPANTGPRC